MRLHAEVPEEKVRDILREFTGEIYQKPPLKASVKRAVRRRVVYKIDFLEMDGRNVLFKIACQAGTYIRKICFDIGEALGCGAHMRELRRTRAGPFIEEDSVTLYDLLNAYTAYMESGDEKALRQAVKPMEEAFKLVRKIYIRDSAVDAICHGADLAVPGIVKLETGIKPEMPIALFTLKGEVVALAKALMSTEQILEKERGLASKTVRVIMPTGVYPPLWRKKSANEKLS
jgi:H/ACA ribonucleoprotein complex subunit 4